MTLKTVLKDLLALPRDYSPDSLPSPEELSMKVLIRGNKAGYNESPGGEDAAGKSSAKLVSTHPDLEKLIFLSNGSITAFTKANNNMTPATQVATYSETTVIHNLRKPGLSKDWIDFNQNHLR